MQSVEEEEDAADDVEDIGDDEEMAMGENDGTFEFSLFVLSFVPFSSRHSETDHPSSFFFAADVDWKAATHATLVRLRRDDLVKLCSTRDIDVAGTKPQLAQALIDWVRSPSFSSFRSFDTSLTFSSRFVRVHRGTKPLPPPRLPLEDPKPRPDPLLEPTPPPTDTLLVDDPTPEIPPSPPTLKSLPLSFEEATSTRFLLPNRSKQRLLLPPSTLIKLSRRRNSAWISRAWDWRTRRFLPISSSRWRRLGAEDSRSESGSSNVLLLLSPRR